MNPKEFLNIVIEKFPLIKIDLERVKDFTDRICSVGITFGTGSSHPWSEEWLCLEEDGAMHYKRAMGMREIPDEDHLKLLVEDIFNSGISVDKVYLTISPEQPKEPSIEDQLLKEMGEAVAKEECQNLINEIRNGEKK